MQLARNDVELRFPSVYVCSERIILRRISIPVRHRGGCLCWCHLFMYWLGLSLRDSYVMADFGFHIRYSSAIHFVTCRLYVCTPFICIYGANIERADD